MNDAVAAMQRLITAAAARAFPEPVTFRAMFGGACGYVDGRVFACLIGDVGLALKLPPADQATLFEQGGKPLQFEPGGPVSNLYAVLPEAVATDADALAEWVWRSADHVRSLPAPKPRKKR